MGVCGMGLGGSPGKSELGGGVGQVVLPQGQISDIRSSEPETPRVGDREQGPKRPVPAVRERGSHTKVRWGHHTDRLTDREQTKAESPNSQGRQGPLLLGDGVAGSQRLPWQWGSESV